jgi:hypothetical protein
MYFLKKKKKKMKIHRPLHSPLPNHLGFCRLKSIFANEQGRTHVEGWGVPGNPKCFEVL